MKPLPRNILKVREGDFSAWPRRRKSEVGAYFVLAGLTLPILVGFALLALDIHQLITTKNRMQQYANLMALSAMRRYIDALPPENRLPEVSYKKLVDAANGAVDVDEDHIASLPSFEPAGEGSKLEIGNYYTSVIQAGKWGLFRETVQYRKADQATKKLPIMINAVKVTLVYSPSGYLAKFMGHGKMMKAEAVANQCDVKEGYVRLFSGECSSCGNGILDGTRTETETGTGTGVDAGTYTGLSLNEACDFRAPNVKVRKDCPEVPKYNSQECIYCTEECQIGKVEKGPHCGDGKVCMDAECITDKGIKESEECDGLKGPNNGPMPEGYRCNKNCELEQKPPEEPKCGDFIPKNLAREECDMGPNGAQGLCTAECCNWGKVYVNGSCQWPSCIGDECSKAAVCGDGMKNSGDEECDVLDGLKVGEQCGAVGTESACCILPKIRDPKSGLCVQTCNYDGKADGFEIDQYGARYSDAACNACPDLCQECTDKVPDGAVKIFDEKVGTTEKYYVWAPSDESAYSKPADAACPADAPWHIPTKAKWDSAAAKSGGYQALYQKLGLSASGYLDSEGVKKDANFIAYYHVNKVNGKRLKLNPAFGFNDGAEFQAVNAEDAYPVRCVYNKKYCVTPPTKDPFHCQNRPANSEPCVEDDKALNLKADRNYILKENGCTVPTPTDTCEAICVEGYHLENGVCVPDTGNKQCSKLDCTEATNSETGDRDPNLPNMCFVVDNGTVKVAG